MRKISIYVSLFIVMGFLIYATDILGFIALYYPIPKEVSVMDDMDDDLSQMILTGYFKFEDGQPIAQAGRSWRKKGVRFPEPKLDTEIEVDILNCAGYLASAKVVATKFEMVKRVGWNLVLVPDSIAPDALEKVKQCSDDPNYKYPSSSIFVVATRDEKRKHIKLSELSGESLFSSLSWSIQSWANCGQSVDQKDCVRKEKNILSKIVGDDWADTDGDGKVDLMVVQGNCNNTGDYTCSKVLRWTGWRWVEIAYITPA